MAHPDSGPTLSATPETLAKCHALVAEWRATDDPRWHKLIAEESWLVDWELEQRPEAWPTHYMGHRVMSVALDGLPEVDEEKAYWVWEGDDGPEPTTLAWRCEYPDPFSDACFHAVLGSWLDDVAAYAESDQRTTEEA